MQLSGETVHIGVIDGCPELGLGGIGDTAVRCRQRGDGAGLGPVVLALEGIGGGVGESGAGAGEEGRPVDRDAMREELRQGREDGCFLGPVLAQRRDDDRAFGRHLLDQGGEGAVGAEFQEAGDALVGEGADAVGETDGLADVAGPVGGVAQVVGGGEGAGEVRDERDAWGAEVDAGQGLGEIGQHRVHERGVEGVGDPQAGGAAPGEGGGHRENGFLRAGEHQGGGAVDRRDAHLVGEVRGDVGFRGLDREHQATRRQRLHQPRSRRHQRTRVRQRQHTRDMGGGDLTDRMSREVLRSDPEGGDQPEQRDLDREEGRLGELRTVQGLLVLAPDQVTQGGVELGQHRVQSLGEHREAAVQFPTHAQTLGTLTREHERQRPLDRHSPGRLGYALRRRQQHCPVREPRTTTRQRVSDIHRRLSRPQHLDLRIQRLPRPRRHHQRHHRRHHRRNGRVGHRIAVGVPPLLQDDVGVGATEAERGHTDAARAVAVRPRNRLPHQFDGTRRPVHMRRRSVDMQGRRDSAVPHRHDRLDQTGGTGGGLGVSEVGLHRPEQQRPFTVLPIGGKERLRLDRVAEAGTGAVCLHDVDVPSAQPR
ncbi:hypothetical protein GCM10010344_79230 [Streptomyces bluensis]|nr:hypothetical protein GCM10010344_79230 [Streptomyces bluensis]